MTATLSADTASHFVRIVLGHVSRQWPNVLGHVMSGPDDVLGPRELHPVFFGSFDWHSCVHGHWLMARLYRRFPQLREASALRAHFDSHFTASNMAGEVAYLARPLSGGFERPYGWAWLLMLAGELMRHESEEGQRWSKALKPLADAFVERFHHFLPHATYPLRAGVHSSTAFALILVRDYADVAGDTKLAALCREKALAWYGEDRDYNSLEPSLDEFLSPSLIEAACMRFFLAPDAFAAWLARFLPHLAEGRPPALFTPAFVSDRSDGHIAHLDGLNLSRAWCWRLILDALPTDHPLQARGRAAADVLLDSALLHVAGDYMGEHWLASFALLALDPYAA